MIHLIRATLRSASRRYGDQLAKDLRSIYTAPSVEAAWAAFEELKGNWGKLYPAIPKLWRAAWWVPRSAWEEFTPFLAHATSRSAGSCPPPTPSSPSTPATAGRSGSRALPQGSRPP